jgi:hypothetical protein
MIGADAHRIQVTVRKTTLAVAKKTARRESRTLSNLCELALKEYLRRHGAKKSFRNRLTIRET